MSPKYRRGYAVAVLVGTEVDQAAVWRIFSNVAKHEATIKLQGKRTDTKNTYCFHEAIVDTLRPIFKEGIKSVIIASPQKTTYNQDFFQHLKSHHSWLFTGTNKGTITQIAGSATTSTQVSKLTSSSEFKQLINETTLQETEHLREILEKRLNLPDQMVLFSLEDAENAIFSQDLPGKPKPEYILITKNFLESNRRKNRIQRLIQIAQNKKVKTRIVNSESPAGVRLNQLGGLVCLLKT